MLVVFNTALLGMYLAAILSVDSDVRLPLFVISSIDVFDIVSDMNYFIITRYYNQLLFSAGDFGGWDKINTTFFGKDGVWDQLFSRSR